ncbi:hypothetical protein DRW03_30975 [Corallococcus sp. H22C18031201]|uniref:bZIP transcription factor n=1 Tax=Citreicoccus inhibens TaxID=2849499 RepID=UPI000E72EDBF|nr:bZIP transcription factor [Citreicoccus inhibens]MBU8900195.1 bZIP transcription factor [Citreicoccus inhibens]RJS16363.1 hypothetical protein DRW03_30975 [Corallococcus sp. H22C18031201]
MTINLTINVSDLPAATVSGASGDERVARLEQQLDALSRKNQQLTERHDELIRQMGNHISPFPAMGVDGFLSHFIIQIQFLKGEMAGRVISLAMPPATQTVSRGAPFIYKGPQANHQVMLELPANCTLANSICESDFIAHPAEYFTPGQETVWMQILNLDSRMETEWGPMRIILGETLKREYPDLFRPSLGIAQSLGAKGFPARLFFNPYAIVETPFGAFRAIHGTLAYGRVTAFPPVGTPVSICECIPLEEVGDVRNAKSRTAGKVEPFARIISLSHPIDTPMQLTGGESFNLIEHMIEQGIKPLANNR